MDRWEGARRALPAEPAGVAQDIVRAMDPKTFQIPKEATDEGKRLRRSYVASSNTQAYDRLERK